MRKKGNANSQRNWIKTLILTKKRSPGQKTVNRRDSVKPIETKDKRADKKQSDFHEGQKVKLMISRRTEIGFIAVINGTHQGILYKNQVFQPLKIGQEIDGFIRKLRDDQKIDLCLQKPGYKAIDAESRKILDQLKEHGGFIPVTDKSSPELISDFFGISKKTFKKAAGKLYKKRLILLEKKGIRMRIEWSKNKKYQKPTR